MESQFFRFLKVVGVGFKARAEAEGRLLYLKLGYSHEVELTVPPAGRVFCFKPNIICCSGIDKYRTHQSAATIRSCKPPEVYKGKGILYYDEVIKLKPVKKAKNIDRKMQNEITPDPLKEEIIVAFRSFGILFIIL